MGGWEKPRFIKKVKEEGGNASSWYQRENGREEPGSGTTKILNWTIYDRVRNVH